MFLGMEIEFHPDKDALNTKNHGVSLAFGAVVLTNRIGEIEDTRGNYGETRIKAFGQVNGLMFCCVYTMRSDVFRIISVYRVQNKEVARWLKSP